MANKLASTSATQGNNWREMKREMRRKTEPGTKRQEYRLKKRNGEGNKRIWEEKIKWEARGRQ